MSKIEFVAAQKEQLAQKLQKYMSKELEVELGQFDAQTVLTDVGE